MATKTKQRNSASPKRKQNSAAVVFVPRRKAAGRRANGFFSRRKQRSKRNPGIGGELTGTVVQAGWTILGAVGSRVISQFILGANNAGLMGYGANGAVTLGLYLVAKSLVKNQAASQAILLGGTVGLVLRALSDYTPFGQWVAQNFSGLGDYQATTFFVPAVPVNMQSTTDASMQIPSAITDQLNSAKAALMASANAAAGKRIAAPAGARAGMGSVADGVGGRYSTKGRYS